MKKSLLLLSFWLLGAGSGCAFDTALYAHCLQWTPHAVGETWYGVSVLRGGAIGIPPIATHPRASDAYKQGVQEFYDLQLTDPLDIAERCALWVNRASRRSPHALHLD